MIRTQGPGQEIIRLEKFVRHVAKKVQKFMAIMVITILPQSSATGTNATKSSGRASALQ